LKHERRNTLGELSTAVSSCACKNKTTVSYGFERTTCRNRATRALNCNGVRVEFKLYTQLRWFYIFLNNRNFSGRRYFTKVRYIRSSLYIKLSKSVSSTFGKRGVSDQRLLNDVNPRHGNHIQHDLLFISRARRSFMIFAATSVRQCIQ